MKIGNAMLTIRKECGLSRKALADKLGCTENSIWKIENGKTLPKRKTIHKFCAEAHIPIAYFYAKAMDLEDYICP